MLKALKRRLSNIKPVVKPQGSTPSKRRYVSDDNKSRKSEQLGNLSEHAPDKPA